MKFLHLRDTDADRLLAIADAADRQFADQVRLWMAAPLLTGAGPRTFLFRDEGDNLPCLIVAYDRREEADAAWRALTQDPSEEELIEWPTN